MADIFSTLALPLSVGWWPNSCVELWLNQDVLSSAAFIHYFCTPLFYLYKICRLIKRMSRRGFLFKLQIVAEKSGSSSVWVSGGFMINFLQK